MSTFSLKKWNQLLPKLSIPIFLGPMAGAAQGALAGQVSRAGGLGFIGAGYVSTLLVRYCNLSLKPGPTR